MVDERLRFVGRLLDGEPMAGLCEEFGISRKTGYKIYARYKDCGLVGLTDRSRRPYRYANRLPMALEKGIVRLKREYPDWGAPKIREYRPTVWGRVGRLRAQSFNILSRGQVLGRQSRRRPRPRAPAPLDCRRDRRALTTSSLKRRRGERTFRFDRKDVAQAVAKPPCREARLVVAVEEVPPFDAGVVVEGQPKVRFAQS